MSKHCWYTVQENIQRLNKEDWNARADLPYNTCLPAPSICAQEGQEDTPSTKPLRDTFTRKALKSAELHFGYSLKARNNGRNLCH